jgi:hypothetical protein
VRSYVGESWGAAAYPKSILGHADLDVTAIYDRSHYTVEKAEAVQKWDDLLMAELVKITPRYPSEGGAGASAQS